MMNNLQYIQQMLDEGHIEIILGEDSEFYLKFMLNDCIKVENIRSKTAMAYLRELCRDNEDSELVRFKLGDIQPILDRKRLYDRAVPIYGRLCHSNNGIEYALYDSRGRIIVLSEDGRYSITANSDNVFYKRGYMLAQPRPKKTNRSLSDLLRPYVNLTDEDFVVFLCLLVTMFIPDISHYAILVSAEFGSGKTTLCNLINELVDHSVGGVSVMPNKVDDIKTEMANRYIVSFDNVIEKDIKSVSDLICSSVTGASFTKRKLYTDLEEVNVHLHNICILNGIRIFDLNKDILSRSLGITPLKITENNRMTDTEYWERFHNDKPMIMYRLFITVADVLKRKGSIHIVSKERMADAYEFVVLAGISLGYKQKYIENLIYNNRQSMSALAYQNENGMVSMIADYIDSLKSSSIEGSVTSVYKCICRFRSPEDYGIEKFPANASAFSRKLTELQKDLLKAGVSLTKTNTKNYTKLTLAKVGSKSKKVCKSDNMV